MADPAPTANEAPLLALEGVSKRFGGLMAVSDLHLVVYRGELRCLIGPNGAGKSTVFKLIMGFERPSRGRITFDGASIDSWPTWRRARQGLSIKMQIPASILSFQSTTICALRPNTTFAAARWRNRSIACSLASGLPG